MSTSAKLVDKYPTLIKVQLHNDGENTDKESVFVVPPRLTTGIDGQLIVSVYVTDKRVRFK
jgi:hypothetical protein